MVVKTSIQVMSGTAKYVKTEVENKFGKWNDNYYVKDGYYVIHHGNQHHLYKKEIKCRHYSPVLMSLN